MRYPTSTALIEGSQSSPTEGRIKLFGAPRQWKHFRPYFKQCFFRRGGVLPPRL